MEALTFERGICDNFVKSVIEADRLELVDSFWFVDFRHEANKG